MANDLTTSGNFKPFCRRAIGLDLWHFYLLIFFQFWSGTPDLRDNSHVFSSSFHGKIYVLTLILELFPV